MATERPTEPQTAPLERAGFVHVLAGPDGDRLAAAGLVGRALESVGVPFQISVGRTHEARTARLDADVDTVHVAVGSAAGDAITLEPEGASATLAAAELASALGHEPDPTLVLAGAIAAGRPASDDALAAFRASLDCEQSPGVGVPTDDPIDGLAHLGSCLAPWSGDLEATRETLGDVSNLRDLASLVALEVVTAPTAGPAAAEAISRVCGRHELPDGPVETAEGYADVLEALARTAPGTGVALTLGRGDRETALSAWREHGRTLHGAIDDATERRRGDVLALAVESGPVDAIARVVAAHRAPIAVVVGPDAVGIAARDGLAPDTLETIATVADDVTGTDRVPAGTVGLVEGTTTLEDALEAAMEVGDA